MGTQSSVGQSSLRSDARLNLEGQGGVSQARRTWKEIIGGGRTGEEIEHETFSVSWVAESLDSCPGDWTSSSCTAELRIKFVF